ncbi:4,5-DOPA dioxygenase extradiol [Hondaea fermentalgiana]|uniref:4,5-DOPA dioxygenase extradiol n=1 Tax=Hondaea fermentalgiana TaxID=2315210 RepID=A0A2R5GAH8_9STRA|nr:4,5-DOPA dioxygenase extradiol [Hondaea fermentalgiana]|eukprot:GBG25081.1 4,5-DOPA dioxygenase extradiol [Hondaea fermentalgiana]
MFGRIHVPRRRLVVIVLLVCILQGAQALAANTTYAPTMSPSSSPAETNESGLTGNNDSQEVLDSEPFDDDSGQGGASSNGKDINEVTAQSPSTSAGEDSASHVGGILGGLAAGVFVLLVGVAYVAVPRVRSRQQDTYDQHQLAAGSGSRSKLRFFENPHDDAGDDLEDNSTLAPKFHQDSVHRHPPSSFAKPSSAPPIISRALAEAEIEIEAEAKARAKAETGARGSRRFVQSLRLAFGLSRSSSSNTKSSSSRFNFLSPDVAVDEEATKPREDLGTFGAPSPRAASGWGRRGFDDDHVQDYDDDNDDDDAAFAGPKMLGSSRRQPSLCIGHGGGPYFLLDARGQGPFAAGDKNCQAAREIRGLWKKLYGPEGAYETPEAIVLVSAHWEASARSADQFEIVDRPSSDAPLLFDYYGFPPETYKYTYNAPLDEEKREHVLESLRNSGIKIKPSTERKSYDHGVYIPLLAMRPQADVPVIQVSLGSSLDPGAHVKLGKALSDLRRDGFLIIGSGMATHNMYAARSTADAHTTTPWAQNFQDWLDDYIANPERLPEESERALLKWESKAPSAREAHPREEHLLPFIVSAAAGDFKPAEKVFQSWMAGSFSLNIYIWHSEDDAAASS